MVIPTHEHQERGPEPDHATTLGRGEVGCVGAGDWVPGAQLAVATGCVITV